MTVSFVCLTESALPPDRLFDLARSIDAHLDSQADTGEQAVAGVTMGLIGAGQEVTWRARHFGVPIRMTSRITSMEFPERFVDEQVRGPFKAFRHVILPQAVLRILGPIGNQLIVLVKDTSLVSAIGVTELTMTGKLAIERSAVAIEIFLAIAVFYLTLTTLLGAGLRVLEHRTAGRF